MTIMKLACSLLLILLLGFVACSDDNANEPATEDSGTVEADVVEDISAEETVQTGPAVEPHLEERGQFTVVWLAGTPYEMGQQHGELLHDVIGEAMEFVMADPMLRGLPQLAENMGIIDAALELSYPDIVAECQGLVDATADVGFTMEYCMALNFGDVMLEWMMSGMPPGCTGVIATGAATSDGRLRHTRNLDWGSMDISIIHQHPVIFVRQPSDGIAHVYVGFPMNLSPYTGMNVEGISIGSHEAEPAAAAPRSREGRSHVQTLAQLLKTATSLDEAIELVEESGHLSTEMIVLADGGEGRGVVLEMSPGGMAVREMENDVVYATNHFVHPDTVDFDLEPSIGSLRRLQRLDQLVSQEGSDSHWGSLDETGMATVMRDTVDPMTGQAPSLADLEALDWDNDIAIGANGPMHLVVFEPELSLFWVAAGELPIHRQPYTCFSLGELLGDEAAEPCPTTTIPVD